MINWEKEDYPVSSAEKDFNALKILDTEITPININNDFQELRNDLLEIRDEVFEEFRLDSKSKLGHEFDLNFGIKFYQILNEKYNFDNRAASNNNIWRFLSVRVIPDIVLPRTELKSSRTYSDSRRLWLKMMWWYIHLAWQGSEEETINILKNNSTDTILQIVDRVGQGYNRELYAEILKQYASYNDRDLFRQVLKLNTAKIVSVTPEFYKDGIPGYVESLFNEVTGK